MDSPITIIGTGLAGYTLAREFRKLDSTTPLRIVTADDGRSYSKPMLSNAFQKEQTADSLTMADAVRMAEQLDAEILTDRRIDSIDTGKHSLSSNQGTLDWSQLVLAIGANTIHIPVKGNAADEVLSVNSLQDYARFRERMGDKKRLAILGAGLIGCEFANDVRHANIEVDVIDMAALPLGRLVPEEAGIAIRDALAGTGIRWHLDTVIETVDRNGDDLTITLANGDVMVVDVLLSAVGLRPAIELAEAAGIQCNRGIVVDRFLRSSATDVYALGDCAEVSGLVLPFVMPIMHAARTLAKTLAGNPAELSYPAMPVLVKTTDYPVVVSPPAPGTEGEWQSDINPDGVRSLFHDKSGNLAGFTLTGTATAEKQGLTKELPALLE